MGKEKNFNHFKDHNIIIQRLVGDRTVKEIESFLGIKGAKYIIKNITPNSSSTTDQQLARVKYPFSKQYFCTKKEEYIKREWIF